MFLIRKSYGKKRFPRNSDIFACIDTKEKAYWLGFLYADGCVLGSTNTLRISLKTADEEHLIKFKNFIEAKNTEIKRNDKKDKKTGKIYPISYFQISDKKIVSDLIKNGCLPSKTYSLDFSFPSENILPKELQYHFLRGIIDGDGSIYEDKKRHRLCLSITGNASILTSIKHILQKPNLELENKGNYSVLHIDGNKQVLNILTKIYEDSSQEIELPRKKKVFENFF